MTSSATILDKIRDYKQEHVAACKEARPLANIEADARNASPTRGFRNALMRSAQQGYGLIAEIKKASPSKGLIREEFDPPVLAKAYEEGGASCLSVLTDGPSFQGADHFLTQAREACSLPALRKDFMLDTYQVAEARALGADAILIIMAMVDDQCAAELEQAAREWNMDVLIEVHNREELDRAVELNSPLIGINNRDLNSFETTLDTTRGLAKLVPADRMIVSESGLNSPDDLSELARYGVRAFLIGESLMRQEDVTAATRQILSHPLTGMATR